MKEGKIIYEHTNQMSGMICNMNERIASHLPKARIEKFELLFANNQSIRRSLPDPDEEANTSKGGIKLIMIRVGGSGDNIIYHNFETGRRVDQRELNAKNYLIEDSIQKLSCKITEEIKNISGYKARKAMRQNIQKSKKKCVKTYRVITTYQQLVNLSIYLN